MVELCGDVLRQIMRHLVRIYLFEKRNGSLKNNLKRLTGQLLALSTTKDSLVDLKLELRKFYFNWNFKWHRVFNTGDRFNLNIWKVRSTSANQDNESSTVTFCNGSTSQLHGFLIVFKNILYFTRVRNTPHFHYKIMDVQQRDSNDSNDLIILCPVFGDSPVHPCFGPVVPSDTLT